MKERIYNFIFSLIFISSKCKVIPENINGILQFNFFNTIYINQRITLFFKYINNAPLLVIIIAFHLLFMFLEFKQFI